jgi:hypothetical protein
MARPRFTTKKAGDQGRTTRQVPRYQPTDPYSINPAQALGYNQHRSTASPALGMYRAPSLPTYGPRAPVQPAPYTGPYDMRQSAAQIRATPQQAPYHGPYDTTPSGATLPAGSYTKRSSMSHQLAYFRNQRANWTAADYADARARLAFSMQYPQENTPFALMLRGAEGPEPPRQYAPGPYYPQRSYGGGGGGYSQPAPPRGPGMGYYGRPAGPRPNVDNWYGQMINWNISGV